MVYFEGEKDLREQNVLKLETLFEKIEASEHWFDFESPLKQIVSARVKEEPPMDDYETLAMLQERVSALNVKEEDPADD
jgi:hypothetical protein